MPVALRVGEPLDQEHADTLPPAGAVGALGKRLAPPVRRQTALPGEPDERPRRRHHGHSARERQFTFAVP